METLRKATQINSSATQIPRYVIPNTKAFKIWLKFENFHFFTEISPFWDMDYFETQKNAEDLAVANGREAAETIT